MNNNDVKDNNEAGNIQRESAWDLNLNQYIELNLKMFKEWK